MKIFVAVRQLEKLRGDKFVTIAKFNHYLLGAFEHVKAKRENLLNLRLRLSSLLHFIFYSLFISCAITI